MWDQVSDTERQAIVVAAIRGLALCDVPEYLRGGLVRYLSDGILPGSFLQAVLCNDLTQACVRADPFALAGLAALAEFLIHYAPVIAWGSRARVLAWTTTPDRIEV